MNLQVYSEIGKLRQVLLHRPGTELESLTPQYLDSMLFEDIPYLSRMQEEHDAFAEVLRQNGCRVCYIEDMLVDVLKNSEVRQRLISGCIRDSGLPDPGVRNMLETFLSGQSTEELSRFLIAGIRKDEVMATKPGTPKDLSFYIRDEYPFYISPLPNLYFTRDPGSVLGSSCSINVMKTEARRRETLILSSIIDNHPHFRNPDGVSSALGTYAKGSSIEGGDILVLNPETVAVGCSARTEAWAIEELAKQVLNPSAGNTLGFSRLLVIQIPFTRAYMHLDTVFTMVDSDKFTIYPGVEPHLKLYTLRLKPDGTVAVTPESGLIPALKKVLEVPAVDLIKTGGGDRITAAREQWNDSTNTLAIAPGVVVTYRRNVVSNDTLEKHGVTVLPVQGSELVRGRGGPRCMSMPLFRDLPQ